MRSVRQRIERLEKIMGIGDGKIIIGWESLEHPGLFSLTSERNGELYTREDLQKLAGGADRLILVCYVKDWRSGEDE